MQASLATDCTESKTNVTFVDVRNSFCHLGAVDSPYISMLHAGGAIRGCGHCSHGRDSLVSELRPQLALEMYFLHV